MKQEERRLSMWTQLLMVVVTLVAGVIGWVLMSQVTPEKYGSVKEQFFRQIEEQVVLGTLKNVEDTEMVQIGVSRQRDSEKLRFR